MCNIYVDKSAEMHYNNTKSPKGVKMPDRGVPQLILREIPVCGDGIRELTHEEMVRRMNVDVGFRAAVDTMAEVAGCATNAHLAMRAAVVGDEAMRARSYQERKIIEMGMKKKAGFLK